MKRVYHYSDSNNVYYNLALEEYFVRNINLSEYELLFIYINEPCIVLGKNQNFFQEVHLRSFFNSSYKLSRRISGGGTVVHDRGNINFAFFEDYNLKKVNNYQSSTQNVTKVLNELGIEAIKNERNAIILEDGKKVSGSAQFSSSKGILSHLTLLYQSDLDKIDLLIQKNPYSLVTKASQSVRSTIDNVGKHTSLNQEEFIKQSIYKLGFVEELENNMIDKKVVENLMKEKYSQPSFYLETAANGSISIQGVEIEISKGYISNIHGMENGSDYLGKRLYPTDIPLAEPLWKVLLDQ